ncbi:hypothetical protein AMATHDRAFT_49300 [Amanita thiersii Skay4041]|uniref:Uncharacterized protein n=1 Tax=Amanita thiersii Skay4041 TaxID=703135 RepID=A0A2A9NF55_9AGAR|nr:hypothetical protein AMATHDRAFT_49300 [Amanita thiersii Skay4041]
MPPSQPRRFYMMPPYLTHIFTSTSLGFIIGPQEASSSFIPTRPSASQAHNYTVEEEEEEEESPMLSAYQKQNDSDNILSERDDDDGHSSASDDEDTDDHITVPGTSAEISQCASCVIRDNDPRVVYSGSWILQGNSYSTTHSTTKTGSAVSLKFNGTGIIVFGTVPSSNKTASPPSATYQIDAEPPVTSTLPVANQDVVKQPLYAVPKLTPSEHQLTINVTNAESPYTLSYFFVIPNNGNTSESAASEVDSSFEDSSSYTQRTVRALAGILGGVVFLVLAVLIVLLVLRHRKMKLKEQKMEGFQYHSSNMKSSELYRGSSAVLTSQASIMRHDPSNLWSGSGDDPNREVGFNTIVPQFPPPLPPKQTDTVATI